MRAGRIIKLSAMALGLGVLLLVAAWEFWLWDNGRVRVYSDEQAVEMAKAAAGPAAAKLPLRVEAAQDFWIVRFGPDTVGKTHSYIVTIWDRRAGPLVFEERANVMLERPK